MIFVPGTRYRLNTQDLKPLRPTPARTEIAHLEVDTVTADTVTVRVRLRPNAVVAELTCMNGEPAYLVNAGRLSFPTEDLKVLVRMFALTPIRDEPVMVTYDPLTPAFPYG